VALQYLDSWLQGNGAAAIYNLMEDAATAEIARSLLWVWRRGGTPVGGAGGEGFSAEAYSQLRDQELASLGGRAAGRLADAADILDGLVLSDDFVEFLTLPAYPLLG